MDIKAMFEKYNDEYLQFDNVENPVHQRPDLCAFLTLDRLCPDTLNIVASVSHDQIWLDTDVAGLSKNATEDDILLLTRCGVNFDEDTESLFMFV